MIRLRSAIPEDLEFTYRLKKRTLKEYIIQTWGWDEEWQWKYHVENFNPEKMKIITENDTDIGCLLVDEFSNRLDINLIEILPEYQNQGIGTFIINTIIKEGLKENKDIELQVLKVNKRALKLYLSLGFVIKSEDETHFHLIFIV
ncbi:MAG: GNAT family N-acetyltransferase [Promethearchaeota archaeon]